jgi:hypothetical protein
MSTVPVRFLQDKDKQPFIPYVPANAVPISGTPYKLTDKEGILAILSKIPGYNVNKNQTLKHSKGVLEWVDVDSE